MMDLHVQMHGSSACGPDAAKWEEREPARYDDPLDDDLESDGVVVTTRRGLTRLAVVSAEVGMRFARQNLLHDPCAWLLAPRRLFGGRSAIEACLEREHFERAVLLHALGHELDADASDIDALLADDADAVADMPSGSGAGIGCDAHRLFTASFVTSTGSGQLFGFHASVAKHEDEIMERLAARIGPAAADVITVREGVDMDDQITANMLSPAMHELLMNYDRQDITPALADFNLIMEQRLLV